MLQIWVLIQSLKVSSSVRQNDHFLGTSVKSTIPSIVTSTIPSRKRHLSRHLFRHRKRHYYEMTPSVKTINKGKPSSNGMIHFKIFSEAIGSDELHTSIIKYKRTNVNISPHGTKPFQPTGYNKLSLDATFLRGATYSQFNITLHTLKELCSMFPLLATNCTCANKYIIQILETLDVRMDTLFCTSNTTESPWEHRLHYYSFPSKAYAGVVTILMIMAFVGNSMVILVSLLKQKVSKYQRLIAQLAMCDITFSIILTITVKPLFWTNHWIYGEVGCKILISSMTLGSLLGINITMIISIERYIGIVYPFQYSKYKHVISILSILNVIICSLTIMPLAWFLHVGPLRTCSDEWPHNISRKLYYGYLLIALNVIPVITVSILYFILVRTLRKKLRKNECRINKESPEYIKRVKHNKRILNILLATAIVFTLSQLPYHIIALYFNAQDALLNLNLYGLSYAAYLILYFVALLPYCFHLVVNPIIYSVIDSTWRNDFKMAAMRLMECFRSAGRVSSLTFRHKISEETTV